MKTKLLIISLFLCLNSFGQKLPITGLCWSDVFTATGTSCSPDAWTAANSGYFDAAYAVSGDCLDDWRNYGPPACSELATITTVSMVEGTSPYYQAEVNMSLQGTGCTVTEMGVVYSTSPTPIISGTHASTPTVATLAYSWSFTGPTFGTNYYYRAFATNSYGTAYGTELTTACTTRPSGLTDIVLVYFTEGVTITSANVCYYASHATDPYGSGSHANWNGTYGTDVFDGTGTDCTKYADGYYLIDGPAPRAGVQVSGGKLNLYCP